jgi:hypothetical protein
MASFYGTIKWLISVKQCPASLINSIGITCILYEWFGIWTPNISRIYFKVKFLTIKLFNKKTTFIYFETQRKNYTTETLVD